MVFRKPKDHLLQNGILPTIIHGQKLHERKTKQHWKKRRLKLHKNRGMRKIEQKSKLQEHRLLKLHKASKNGLFKANERGDITL